MSEARARVFPTTMLFAGVDDPVRMTLVALALYAWHRKRKGLAGAVAASL